MKILLFVMGLMLAIVSEASAAFTMPTLPVTDLELAGTAVAGLVAVAVCIRVAIRVLKGA